MAVWIHLPLRYPTRRPRQRSSCGVTKIRHSVPSAPNGANPHTNALSGAYDIFCPYRGTTPYEHPYGCRTSAPIGAKDRVSGQKVVAPYEDRSAVDVRGRMTRFFNLRPLWGSYKYDSVPLRPRGVKLAPRSYPLLRGVDLSEVLTPGYSLAMPIGISCPYRGATPYEYPCDAYGISCPYRGTTPYEYPCAADRYLLLLSGRNSILTPDK